ncbi:glutamyl-tRNA reductase [Campylobacter avium LMG 24591]|uniref:Glutamyl-tRNA reductase n=1 Tax=Campylobacter avium LMG 24591 TaxID=522484 RepID=A0A222MZ00_9BACT|nr:glutamyl-tRNA reductase [Campylobacter avium]ASQ30782.1 glutamyl-tRNA reductase [Campylobacter avium LMG 24591]OYD78594.1 glutamyl-tRNA reductase [Campylobacter avium]
MHYVCVSWTHKNTDIALREKLSLLEFSQKKLLQSLLLEKNILECMLLSTCNRVELFLYSIDPSLACKQVVKSMSKLCEINEANLSQRADFFEDSSAIHHLFSVASSLDSLVVGETQIAGQLKESFSFAIENNFCAKNLSRALHFAFKCGAKIRTQTEISKNPVSVASVAITKAKDLANLEGKDVLVLGAGQMSELLCKHLLGTKADITVLSRNYEKSKNLALALGVKNEDISKLKELVNSCEFIFCATSSKDPVITDELLEEVEFKRYFFDIAVPRDVDIKENDKVKVFVVDDLKDVVKKNLALRESEAHNAYAIIGKMTVEFFRYLDDLELNPIIKDLRLIAKDCAQKELKKAIKKGYLKNSDKEEARKLIHQVFKAFLHTPTMKLKHLEGKVQSDTVANAMRYIFALDEKAQGLDEYKCEYAVENKNEI